MHLIIAGHALSGVTLCGAYVPVRLCERASERGGSVCVTRKQACAVQ